MLGLGRGHVRNDRHEHFAGVVVQRQGGHGLRHRRDLPGEGSPLRDDFVQMAFDVVAEAHCLIKDKERSISQHSSPIRMPPAGGHGRCQDAKVTETPNTDQPVMPDQKVAQPSPVQSRRTSGLDAVVQRRRAVRAAQKPSPDPTSGSAAGDGRSGTEVEVVPKSILVIDDVSDLLDLTVMLLQLAGHRVVGSTDGAKAVASVIKERVDVVVLDFLLVGMTGGDVCAALRAHPTTRDVKIILVSGTPEDVIRRTCTQYNAFLRKPAAGAALLGAIDAPSGRC